jgi:xanthine dehydrogenase molybdopterin-binding subunit B
MARVPLSSTGFYATPEISWDAKAQGAAILLFRLRRLFGGHGIR